MPKLVLIRHGQSVWNKKNIFTGWVDVTLSEEGVKEAVEAGRKIADYSFDSVFTSNLIRAQSTATIVLAQNHNLKSPVMIHDGEKRYELPENSADILPIYVSEMLNERHYGDLQGKNKEEVLAEVGPEQFKMWRRSFNTPPPNGESLQMTIERTQPYFTEHIVSRLVKGETVLVSAHGNSIRGILKELENISDDEIVNLEIETGVPIIFEFDAGMWSKLDEGM